MPNGVHLEFDSIELAKSYNEYPARRTKPPEI